MTFEITVVLTSCNRPKELQITLKSFFKFNTSPIKKIIIIDDSGKQGCIDEAIKEIPANISRKIIYNNKNLGQIHSIDIAYSLVDTEYIFHCEDDWEFYDHGFIENSLEILKKDNNIFCVWLRQYKKKFHRKGKLKFEVSRNGHPVTPTINHNLFRYMGTFQERTNIWSGFTFNPGLRRTKDCKLLMPYKQFINSKECNEGGVEQALSNLYLKNGFKNAISLNENGYVKHIGWGKHCY